MDRLRGFLLHIGVICSCVCVIAKVLDWYNPYMDFTGHVWYMQIALYIAVILLALMKKPKKGFCDWKRGMGMEGERCGNRTERIQRMKII